MTKVLVTNDVLGWLKEACDVDTNLCTEVVIRIPTAGLVTITAVHQATEKLIARSLPVKVGGENPEEPTPPPPPANETTTKGPMPPHAPSSPNP